MRGDGTLYFEVPVRGIGGGSRSVLLFPEPLTLGGHLCYVAIVTGVNETCSNLFESAMRRTVTIGGPNGSPAVKLKLLHAAAAAAAGVVLAPRVTAAAAVGAMIKGVTVTIDDPAPEEA